MQPTDGVQAVTPAMMTMNDSGFTALTKADFTALSEFRYRLRQFLRFSENAAHELGITPQQYLLMLHIKGYPGRNWATIGELAERLQAQHHGVVALVSRCEKLQLVRRQPSVHDRRQVEVHLLPRGERTVERLAQMHRTELQRFCDTFLVSSIT